jgi:hypothetical protein
MRGLGWGYLPGVALLLWVDRALLQNAIPQALILFGWLAAIAGSMVWHAAWRCPRCGYPFVRAGSFGNAWTRHCLNCGLPIWAPRNPDSSAGLEALVDDDHSGSQGDS